MINLAGRQVHHLPFAVIAGMGNCCFEKASPPFYTIHHFTTRYFFHVMYVHVYVCRRSANPVQFGGTESSNPRNCSALFLGFCILSPFFLPTATLHVYVYVLHPGTLVLGKRRSAKSAMSSPPGFKHAPRQYSMCEAEFPRMAFSVPAWGWDTTEMNERKKAKGQGLMKNGGEKNAKRLQKTEATSSLLSLPLSIPSFLVGGEKKGSWSRSSGLPFFFPVVGFTVCVVFLPGPLFFHSLAGREESDRPVTMQPACVSVQGGKGRRKKYGKVSFVLRLFFLDGAYLCWVLH